MPNGWSEQPGWSEQLGRRGAPPMVAPPAVAPYVGAPPTIPPVTAPPYTPPPVEGETDWWNKYAGWLPFVEEYAEPAIGALPEGYYNSPFDVPPDITANYNIEYDRDLMLWRVGDMKAPPAEVAGMTEFEKEYAKREIELQERLVFLKEQEAKWKAEQAETLTPYQEAELELERNRAAQAQQELDWRRAQGGILAQYQAAQINLAQQELQQEYTLATQAAPMSEYQASQLAFQQQQFGQTQEQWAWEQEEAARQFALTQEQWRAQQAQQAQQFGLTQEQWLHEQEQARLAQEQQMWGRGISETQMEQQYGLQQQQLTLGQQTLAWQQSEAQRLADIQQQNYLAGLAARPMSWLEYSAAAGETPAIQPWMQPLMPQQYSQLGAGAAIPGYTPERMAEMPALTTPSRQYQARMGPTGYEQYLGYRQARTGARPEETEFRLWSQAPPGGQHRGLTYGR